MPNASRIDLPRPAIIVAIGAAILALTFVITHKGSDTGTSTPVSSTGATSSSTTTSTATSTTQTSTTATTTTTAEPAEPAVQPGQGLPVGVARALNAGKVVVLFFYEPSAADDQATKAAVRAVRSTAGAVAGKVRLFQDIVAHISNYRRVTGGLGISQVPAMVVIDKHRNAKLLEGYQDAGTIRQSVADAL